MNGVGTHAVGFGNPIHSFHVAGADWNLRASQYASSRFSEQVESRAGGEFRGGGLSMDTANS